MKPEDIIVGCLYHNKTTPNAICTVESVNEAIVSLVDERGDKFDKSKSEFMRDWMRVRPYRYFVAYLNGAGVQQRTCISRETTISAMADILEIEKTISGETKSDTTVINWQLFEPKEGWFEKLLIGTQIIAYVSEQEATGWMTPEFKLACQDYLKEAQ